MINQNHREKRFSSPQSLAETLAQQIAKELCQAVRARKTASLIVPGGRTPMVLFEQLQHQDIPWSAVYITLTDDRWIATDAPDSNEGLVRKMLLRGAAKNARFVGLKNNVYRYLLFRAAGQIHRLAAYRCFAPAAHYERRRQRRS